jgi:hypothetical protein
LTQDLFGAFIDALVCMVEGRIVYQKVEDFDYTFAVGVSFCSAADLDEYAT